MKIESEIQQVKPFRSPQHKALVNLIFTYSWAFDQVKLILQPLEVTYQQLNVLKILKGADGPLTTSIIRKKLIDKKADTSRLVERLAKKGLVIKNTCCGDKRLVDVELSEKGENFLLEIEGLIPEFDTILSNISDEEATVLSNLLDKIRG